MNSKKFIKSAFSILLALSVVCTSNVVYASDTQSAANSFNESEYISISEKLESMLPDKKEEVKEITNIEELDTKVLNNDSDSAFKSCRLIIYSDKDMEFKDIKGRNNIKKVQKLNKMYIVEYASVKDTEDAYNIYTSLGVEVEIDIVNNTPEGVDNKDGENKDVRNEEIASTNETKPTESIDRVKEAVINAIPFSISVVTFMELLQGARNRNEMDAIKKEFNEMGVHIIPINARISSEAANLVEEYTLSHSMEMADALIAGTCLENNEELLTANDKHYRMIDNLEIAVFRS